VPYLRNEAECHTYRMRGRLGMGKVGMGGADGVNDLGFQAALG